MYDKLVLYQRESMENDMLTLKEIKSCRLPVIRTATGMLQSELADKAGISIRTLQSYEEGVRSVNKMSPETVYRFAKVLNAPMEDLVKKNRQRKTARNESGGITINTLLM